MAEEKPVFIRRSTKPKGISEQRTNNAKTQSQYQPCKDAAWGFINHWYPALFFNELAEDQVEGIQICGIPIVLRRVDGKVYALKDQCLHRGVRLSEKPICFNKKTISCWCHGFTFDLEDVVEDETGPKGMMQWLFTDKWTPVMKNEELGVEVNGLNARPYRTSVVLPGVLMVENWPGEHMVQYEWYVPITDDLHECWEVIVRVCDTPKVKEEFQYKFDRVYKPLALHGFNGCDLYVRAAMQNFYADGTGWDDEQLVSTDISPITWRKLSSRWNRGIAKPGKGVDGCVKNTSMRFKRAADGKPPAYKVEKIED